MKDKLLKIRSYLDDPQSTGKPHYGRWGALNPEQRRTFREIIDYAIYLEGLIDDLVKEKVNEDRK